MFELLSLSPYLIIGVLLGATLNYFQFGFSSSFRTLILDKNTLGFRALLWMLGLAILLFAPMLAIETWQDQNFRGFIRPLSLAVPLGALIFGFGMQISYSCTSGTLNRVGQLQSLSFWSLIFMIIGGTIAAATFDNWQWLPTIESFSFQQTFGWLLGLAIQILLLIIAYKALIKYEQVKTRRLVPLVVWTAGRLKPHPFLLAGLSLAILNALLLFWSGNPWSISSVFPFWGVHFIEFLQLPFDWLFWDYTQENSIQLNLGIFENPVSLTTFGVILGAFLVSLGRLRFKIKITKRRFAMTTLGGLIMGFGAVMASGCNIGAFFSGVASGSLHGWVWLGFALIGNILGLKLRLRLLR